MLGSSFQSRHSKIRVKGLMQTDSTGRMNCLRKAAHVYCNDCRALDTLHCCIASREGIRELGSSRMVGSAIGTIVCLLALIARQIQDKAAKAEFMFAEGLFAASPRVPPLLACRRATAARMVKVAEAK
jgi:hypothetical protein